jgi:hypothetical protein
MRSRITVITAGHLATAPRMLKAADALAGAGHRVRVVSTRHVDWAAAADLDARRSREGRWDWVAIDYRRHRAPRTWLWTGARMRIARGLAARLGPARLPVAVAACALSRAHPELLRAALAVPADLFYGGSVGALAAAAAAGRRSGVPYALDLEDFHAAEAERGPGSALAHALVARVERAALPGAAWLTAGSGPIASAYRDAYGVAATAIHNTFPLPRAAPALARTAGRGLSLYWFSQTIGPGRGLEDAVCAMGLAGIPGELHLRGRAVVPYLDALRRLAAGAAPALRIVHHEPAPPDAMGDLCAPHDVGLSLEQPQVLNRDLCLTNKVFTYMLAGLPVVLTATRGHRALAGDLEEGALTYPAGDIGALARGLERWAGDDALLARARRASWEAARRRWHWEHAEERGALLAGVAAVLGRARDPLGAASTARTARR